MNMLANVLDFTKKGLPVPAETFQELSSEEQAVVRDLESSRSSLSRWREVTLSILRTATDLSRSQDRMRVLEELVHNARQIMKSDVAYISLNDPKTSDTTVLTTSGVVTELFRNIRIPLGVGIMGTVAATKKAAWTFDHMEDPHVTHVPKVDAAVRAEGIRGILGAPLAIDGEIIGALLVGDRQPRAYEADEIIVLDSLASLASVALETAQLIEDLEANIDAVKEAHARSEEQIRQLELLSETDSQLMGALASGARTKDVESVLREKLDCSVWFWRENEPYPSEKGESLDIAPDLVARMRELIDESLKAGDIAVRAGYSALAISVNQRNIGAICVDREVSSSDARVLFRASQSFATILVFRQALLDAESRQINDLLTKVIEGIAADEDLSRIKKMTGMDLRDTKNLYFAAIVSNGGLPNPRTVDRLMGENAIVFEHERHLCVVVRAEAGLSSAFDPVFKHSFGARNLLYFGAVSFGARNDDTLGAHSRAVSLAQSMIAIRLNNQVATPTTFGSLGLLLNAEGVAVEQIISDSIGKLISYDEKHRTELAITASTYFDRSQSIPLTAKAMFVHENTVRQRIDRITRLLGAGWNTGPQAFDTHLALRAWQISNGDVHDHN